MLLLDSFCVDYICMYVFVVCIVKKMNMLKGDFIIVYDLCFCIFNQEVLLEKGIYILEYLFVGFMCDYLNVDDVEIIDILFMGCCIGFYMSLIGMLDEECVVKVWLVVMNDVLKV